MMLTEQHAYSNRWRSVSPDAKATFAALALIAAFVAHPLPALGLAAVVGGVTVLGAGVSVRSYAKIAVTPWSFLFISAVTLAVSVQIGGDGWLPVTLTIEPGQAAHALAVVARSIAALSATLFLALTTPMTDVISLARRMRVPATLVEMMTICYRSMFVLLDVMHDMGAAQAARLGHATWRNSMRSMGTAVALLAVETWRRSIIMHQASLARGGGEELRFLEPQRDGIPAQLAVALSCGTALVVAAALIPGSVR